MSGKQLDVSAATEQCSWDEVRLLVKKVASKLDRGYDCVLGISTGGIIPAKLLAAELGLDSVQLIPVRSKEIVTSEMPALDTGKRYIVIDDIYDTGSTFSKVSAALSGYSCDYAFCMSRYGQKAGVAGRVLNHERWIVFPWE